MISEISQSPEDKYCMVSLLEGPRGEKFRETKRMVVARDWGRGGIGGVGGTVSWMQFQFCRLKRSGGCANSMSVLNTAELDTQKQVRSYIS